MRVRAPPPTRTVPRPGRLADQGRRGPRAGFAADRAPLAPPGRAAVRDVPSPLVLARRFAGRGLWSAGPVAVQRPPPPAPFSGRLHAPLLARWRALPAELGRVCGAGRTGRRAPSPAAGLRGSPGWARARRLHPGPACRFGFRFLPPLHFVSLSAHGRLMEGRVHSPLYPARPLSLGSCSRLRRISVWRPGPCSPVP